MAGLPASLSTLRPRTLQRSHSSTSPLGAYMATSTKVPAPPPAAFTLETLITTLQLTPRTLQQHLALRLPQGELHPRFPDYLHPPFPRAEVVGRAPQEAALNPLEIGTVSAFTSPHPRHDSKISFSALPRFAFSESVDTHMQYSVEHVSASW